MAHVVKPDIILGCQRKLAADKFDGAEQRKSPGQPRIDKELEDLIVQMAKENRSWGYDRLDQGKGNGILFPSAQAEPASEGTIECQERLGGLLKHYFHKAA